MSNRKVIVLCLLTNMTLLAFVAGMFAWTHPVRAQGSPNAPDAPAQPQAGPYYASFSGADFQDYEDGLGSFRTKRAGYALVRDSTFSIAVTGLHLPPGATIVSLGNDSAAVENGKTQLRLKQCPLYNDNCSEIGVAEQNVQGRHLVTTNLNIATDTLNNAYMLQIDFPDDSGFYTAYVGYTVPSSFLFLPSLQR